NPKPETQNPKPETLNPKPETRNPKTETREPKPETRPLLLSYPPGCARLQNLIQEPPALHARVGEDSIDQVIVASPLFQPRKLLHNWVILVISKQLCNDFLLARNS
ncbi:hypothetical protein T484DRAFT_1610679, partial [Baffinella frigidus]